MEQRDRRSNVLNVAWMLRGTYTRIISLREANGREITRYEREKFNLVTISK